LERRRCRTRGSLKRAHAPPRPQLMALSTPDNACKRPHPARHCMFFFARMEWYFGQLRSLSQISVLQEAHLFMHALGMISG